MVARDPDQNIQDDDYDEEADSDFDDHASVAGSASSSAEDELATSKKAKATKKVDSVQPVIEELDSGDEVTIKERQKSKKRQKRKKDGQQSSDDDQGDQWKAKTRSMRAQEKFEKEKKTLASIKTSTIDVDKIWEDLNKPGPLPPIRIEGELEGELERDPSPQQESPMKIQAKSGMPVPVAEEMITIKRQFKFAGEVHTEEKIVPKASAEAKLWLSQQENKNKTTEDGASDKQRPSRKISRFDPNYSNLDAFRNDSIKAQQGAFKGPKLNVVEKSKMDWASHVDAEGLKDELDVHAKAKDAYLNRMDFLGQVEQRKEKDAREARHKG